MKVTKQDKGLRLDHYLKNHLGPEHSAKSIKHAIEQGQCEVNGKIDFRPHYRCRHGDKVVFNIANTNTTAKKSRKKNATVILWEDDYYMAIDKITGFSSAELEAQYSPHAQLVHRLDKPTSGVLLMAKNTEALNKIETLFKHHLIQKTYLAFIQGCWRKEEGTIHTSHGARGKLRGLQLWGAVTEGGKEAITAYQVLAKDDEVALVQFHPKTGRTHQIRCHAAEGGHPVVGDTLYGIKLSAKLISPRMLLHASTLAFRHPYTNKEIELKSPLPREFVDFCKKRKAFKKITTLYSKDP